MGVAGGTIVVTGATSGIGLETARRLAGTAGRLVVQGPEPESSVQEDLEEIAVGTADVVYVSSDFTELEDVVAGARAISDAADGDIDAVINNAGMPGSQMRLTTPDGHERTLQVNFLAMVLLTELLRPTLVSGARVVNLASATHEMTALDLADIQLERDYSAVRAYARSKLAIIMYTRWLARSHDAGFTAVSLSPGVINTDLLHAMFGLIGGSLERGARNVIEALTVDAAGGEYFDDGRLVDPSPEARDDRLGDRLMAWTFGALGEHLRR